jgi:hypothetical protein
MLREKDKACLVGRFYLDKMYLVLKALVLKRTALLLLHLSIFDDKINALL